MNQLNRDACIANSENETSKIHQLVFLIEQPHYFCLLIIIIILVATGCLQDI